MYVLSHFSCVRLCAALWTTQPARLLCPWDSPGKNIGVGCHALPEKATATHSSILAWKDGGAWWAAVHGVAKSQTGLSDFPFTFHFHALKKEMATHSSVLAWRIPGTGEPGGLPSMGSHRVGHDWSDLAAAAAEDKDSSCFAKAEWLM